MAHSEQVGLVLKCQEKSCTEGLRRKYNYDKQLMVTLDIIKDKFTYIILIYT